MKAKKFLALAVTVVMVAALALAGCSSGTPASSSAAESPAASSDEATELNLLTPGTLTVLTSPDYPPFENLVDGEYVGLDIAITEAIAEKLDLTVEFKNLQFDAIIPAIVAGGQGDMGISGFSVDPERAKEVDFTEAYFTDNQAVAVMDDSAITEDDATVALDSADITIGVQSGTTGEDYVRENFPNAAVSSFGNSTDAFAAMQAGTVNAVCTNQAVVENMLATAYNDARIVLTAATGEDYAIVVNQDNPELLAALNQALDELIADGTIDKLVAEYMGAAGAEDAAVDEATVTEQDAA